MLKPAWYLPDTSWFAQLPDAPKLHEDGQAVIGQLVELLALGSYVNPAVTVAATRTLIVAAEHLGDTMTHAAELHDLAEVARLLCGLNLAQAYLTQAIQRIAVNTDTRAFPGTAEVPANLLRALTGSLSAAGASGEILAGHLKEAYLALRGIAEGPDAR